MRHSPLNAALYDRGSMKLPIVISVLLVIVAAASISWVTRGFDNDSCIHRYCFRWSSVSGFRGLWLLC